MNMIPLKCDWCRTVASINIHCRKLNLWFVMKGAMIQTARINCKAIALCVFASWRLGGR